MLKRKHLFSFLLGMFLLATTKVKAQEVQVVGIDALLNLLDQKSDTTYIVNFWATWCGPCVQELPYFEEVNKTYANSKVKIVLVSLDSKRKLQDQVLPFVKKRNLQSTLLLLDAGNPNDWIDRIDPKWSGSIPATIFVNGQNRWFMESAFTKEELKETIDKFLAL